MVRQADIWKLGGPDGHLRKTTQTLRVMEMLREGRNGNHTKKIRMIETDFFLSRGGNRGLAA